VEEKGTTRVAEVELPTSGSIYVCKCGGVYLVEEGKEPECMDLGYLQTLVRHLTILVNLSEALRYLKTGGTDEPEDS